jgi:hypothetical protein
MPNQFFGPYVDMGGYPPFDIKTQASTYGWTGAIAAFIQADPNGNPAWSGLQALPVVPTSICSDPNPQSNCTQAAWIAMNLTNYMNAPNSNLIISFGGQANTSLAQYYFTQVNGGSLTNAQAVKKIVTSIESVIKMYPSIVGLDFDIEGGLNQMVQRPYGLRR